MIPRFFFYLFFFSFCIAAYSEDITRIFHRYRPETPCKADICKKDDGVQRQRYVSKINSNLTSQPSTSQKSQQIGYEISELKQKKIHLANAFDFPIAPPNADEFYKSRGFREGGHLGEDWVHEGGSASSFGRPVYTIGPGIVMLARDVHVAWGNVIVIRHAYLEKGKIIFIDSLYAHLDRIHVKQGDIIFRGQQIGTIGNNHGMYPSHLHFEVHKNLDIGVNHTGFLKTAVNYWVPTNFILKHRILEKSTDTVTIPSTHFDIPSPYSFNPHQIKRKHRKKKKT